MVFNKVTTKHNFAGVSIPTPIPGAVKKKETSSAPGSSARSPGEIGIIGGLDDIGSLFSAFGTYNKDHQSVEWGSDKTRDTSFKDSIAKFETSKSVAPKSYPEARRHLDIGAIEESVKPGSSKKVELDSPTTPGGIKNFSSETRKPSPNADEPGFPNILYKNEDGNLIVIGSREVCSTSPELGKCDLCPMSDCSAKFRYLSHSFCENCAKDGTVGLCLNDEVQGMVQNFMRIMKSSDTNLTQDKQPQLQVESKKSPVESKKSPVESKKSPVKSKKSPVESKKSSVESKKSPVESKKSPKKTRRKIGCFRYDCKYCESNCCRYATPEQIAAREQADSISKSIQNASEYVRVRVMKDMEKYDKRNRLVNSIDIISKLPVQSKEFRFKLQNEKEKRIFIRNSKKKAEQYERSEARKAKFQLRQEGIGR